MSSISVGSLLLMALALGVGILFAGLRLQFASRDFGHPLTYRDALAATAIGGLAGFVFFQIVGQVAARGATLRRVGVPTEATAVITLYERSVALVVLGGGACAGAVYLFGRIGLQVYAGGAGLLLAAGCALLTVSAVLVFGWRDLIGAYVMPLMHWQTSWRLLRIAGLTLAIQAGTLAAYMLAASPFTAGMPAGDVMAAFLIVMLAASLPISFSGWGIRELSAVAALGAIGVDASHALVASVLVGVMSLMVISASAAWAALCTWNPVAAEFADDRLVSSPFGRAQGPGLLALLTGLFILFQIQVPLIQGPVNVSPADLFAALCGTLVLLDFLRSPRFRYGTLARFALLGSLVFLFSYGRGLMSFGTSEWAAAKFAGWLVLLGYAAAGAALAKWSAVGGISRLATTLGIAAAAIVLFDFGLSLIVLTYRFQGLSGNPNAFAFALLMCFAVCFAVIRDRRTWLPIGSLLIAGIVLTGSRAGMVTLAIMLTGCLVLRRSAAPALLKPMVWGAVAIVVVKLMQIMSGFLALEAPLVALTLRPQQAIEAYDAERWRTIVEGLRLFVEHPLFGAGLGYFYEHVHRPGGNPLVIHSVPVWIVAEFGLLGAILCIAFIVAMVRRMRGLFASDASLLVLLVGGAFGLFGLAHDIFYQRTFWFLLGAALTMTEAARAHAAIGPPGVKATPPPPVAPAAR